MKGRYGSSSDVSQLRSGGSSSDFRSSSSREGCKSAVEILGGIGCMREHRASVRGGVLFSKRHLAMYVRQFVMKARVSMVSGMLVVMKSAIMAMYTPQSTVPVCLSMSAAALKLIDQCE